MPHRTDVWLAAALVVASVVAAVLVGANPPHRPLDAPGLAFTVVSALCLLWRQAAPMPVLVATGALVVGNAVAGYPPTIVQWPAWIATFTVFATYGWVRRAVGAAVTALSVAGYLAFDFGSVDAAEVFGLGMIFVIAAVAGDAARSRRSSARSEQARLLAEERTRLSRELHDALGHAVNVMVMQAGVGRRVFADNPAFAREALGHIENVGRDALGELDRLLRVVHSDDPPPDLSELADRVRAAGRELRLTGDVELARGTGRTVRRIVQEAVTNALRHTSSGRIDVDLAVAGGSVVVEVVNEAHGLAVPTPGRGLVNMRERARLEGGSFEAGPFEGGFRVRATLPVRP
ncbi:sensor histidine kinase [Saccharothrix isguenensis]